MCEKYDKPLRQFVTHLHYSCTPVASCHGKKIPRHFDEYLEFVALFQLFIYLFIYLCIYSFIYVSVHLSMYLFIYLCVYSFIYYLFIYLRIYSFIYVSIHLSMYLFIYLCIYSFIYVSIDLFMYLSMYLSIYLCIYLSIHPSIYPSIYSFIYLFIYLLIRQFPTEPLKVFSAKLVVKTSVVKVSKCTGFRTHPFRFSLLRCRLKSFLENTFCARLFQFSLPKNITSLYKCPATLIYCLERGFHILSPARLFVKWDSIFCEAATSLALSPFPLRVTDRGDFTSNGGEISLKSLNKLNYLINSITLP